jgi:hypothetical protein
VAALIAQSNERPYVKVLRRFEMSPKHSSVFQEALKCVAANAANATSQHAICLSSGQLSGHHSMWATEPSAAAVTTQS